MALSSNNQANDPIGILDIGSNSVRMVVYEHPFIGEAPIFNEKVQCSLGRDLTNTGKLYPCGKKCTLEALAGFKSIAKAMGVKKIHSIATAAMRDASDGQKFVRTIFEKTGLKVIIIDGEKEAFYSALGITTYFPKAAGIMGDMGGGSLELAKIGRKKVTHTYSFPLGALRIMAEKNPKAYIKNQLEQISPELCNQSVFYAIGGTWRTLAYLKITMNKQAYTGVRGYEIDAKTMSGFAAKMSEKKPSTLIRKYHVEQKRADLLPYSALLFSKLLPKLNAEKVVFSDTSIREGKLVEILSEQKVKKA